MAVAGSSPTNGHAIQLFTAALDQALHDARHELIGDAQIVHFWDDDSLHLPVRGVLALRQSDPQHQTDQLVQSLFAGGFLGTVSLLGPHRSEFVGQVSHWLAEHQGGKRHQRAEEFKLREPLMRGILALDRSIRAGDADTDLDNVLQQLKEIEPSEFIQLESLAGTWQQRLTRLLRTEQVDMTEYDAPLSELRQAPEFARISDLLTRYRSKEARPLATAIDAAALTSLILLNREASLGRSKVFPRFFTSSASLKRMFSNSKWLRGELSFGEGPGDRGGTVWRTADYYYLRSVFPTLRLNRIASSSLDATSPSMAELQDLLVQIQLALSSGPEALSAIMQTRVSTGGPLLTDLITDLERTRMSRIWIGYTYDSMPTGFLESVQSLARQEDSQVTDRLVGEWEAEIERRIGLEVRDFRLSVNMVDAVIRGLEHIQRLSPSMTVSLKNDLASVRWGVEFDDEQDRVQVRHSNGTWDHDQILRSFDLSFIRQNAAACTRSVAVLLGLEEFDLARELLDSTGHGERTPVHQLMHIVAILGGKRTISEAELSFHFSALQRQWEQLDESERDQTFLGYGFAAFAAWSRSAFGGAWNFSSPRDELGWGRWSLELVQDRIDRVENRPLPYLYAVNHLVFVAATLGAETPDFTSRLLNLEAIGSTTRNYRLLDTVGFAIARVADDSDFRPGGIPRDSQTLNRAIAHLNDAIELRPDDMEVRRHLDWAAGLTVDESHV